MKALPGIIIWLTASLVLLEIMYPATVLLEWRPTVNPAPKADMPEDAKQPNRWDWVAKKAAREAAAQATAEPPAHVGEKAPEVKAAAPNRWDWAAKARTAAETEMPAPAGYSWHHSKAESGDPSVPVKAQFDPGGHWQRLSTPAVVQMAKNIKDAWADGIGHRRPITALERWEDPHSDNQFFKEWPDFRRMIAEASITILIGVGLIVALGGRATNAQRLLTWLHNLAAGKDLGKAASAELVPPSSEAPMDTFVSGRPLKADHAAIHMRRALHLGANGFPEAALKCYAKALAINADLFEAYLGRSLLWRDQREYQHAIDHLQQVLELKPDLADAYMARASCYEALGLSEQATVDYTEVLGFQPKHLEARLSRARISNFEGFKNDWEAALSLGWKPSIEEIREYRSRRSWTDPWWDKTFFYRP